METMSGGITAWPDGVFDGPEAGFHSWQTPLSKCARCGIRYGPGLGRCPEATWLEELAAEFGDPKAPEPAGMIRHGSPCVRSLWLWFVDGKNHLLTVDRFARWWEITAEAHQREPVQHATARCHCDGRPDDVIRRVLAAAGWLA